MLKIFVGIIIGFTFGFSLAYLFEKNNKKIENYEEDYLSFLDKE